MNENIRMLVRCCTRAIAGILLVLVTLAMTVAATPAREATSFSVLFIGNSHLFVNNVPQRVQERLRSSRGSVQIKTFTRGGAQLASFTRRTDVETALKSRTWNVVVLQEASATFLAPGGSERFDRSVAWFRKRLPATTQIVLYQTWPWRDGSRYFKGRASNTRHMWRIMRTAYARIAQQREVIVAPVGMCWVRSPSQATLYSADGNHASVAGSRLAARILAATIAGKVSAEC